MSFQHHLDDSMAEFDSYLGRAKRAVAHSPEAPGFLTGATAGGFRTGQGERDRTSSLAQAQHFKGWVYAAIRTIAQRAASQPIRLARRRGASGKGENKGAIRVSKDLVPTHLKAIAPALDLVESHPFLDAMRRPNDVMQQFSLMFVTLASLELSGAAYWLLKDGKGKDRGGFWHLPTPWVKPVHDDRPFSAWEVTPYMGAYTERYKRQSILKFAYPNPSDPLGHLSPTQMQSSAILADEAIQTAQERAFKNGIFPGLLLTVGRQQEVQGVNVRPRLSRDQRMDIVHAVKQMYRGVMKYDEPLILDALIEKVSKLSNAPREMDFLNSGKQTKARILQGYGLNPFIMGEIENANRAVAVVAEQNFADNVVNPRIDLLSQILTYMLLHDVYGSTDLYCYIEPVRANDPEMQLKEREQLIKSGALMRDELRLYHNLPPLPNGAGQTIILMPGQALIPADEVALAEGGVAPAAATNGRDEGRQAARFSADEDVYDQPPAHRNGDTEEA